MSKRMTELKAQIDKTKKYPLGEAIELVKKTSTVKFDASVEIHANLGIDPKQSDQQIRTTVVLPHGNGKEKKIAAFVGPNDEKSATAAGADFVYGEEEIQTLKQTGKIEFDIAIATPEMMPKIAVVAKILGPRGLMPNPKTGTVGPDVEKMIGELKSGKVSYKNDNTSNIHLSVGKVSFSDEQLHENITAFLDSLKKVKPSSTKGIYIKGLFLTSAMGPSVRLEAE